MAINRHDSQQTVREIDFDQLFGSASRLPSLYDVLNIVAPNIVIKMKTFIGNISQGSRSW